MSVSALAVAVIGALAAVGSWLDSRSRARRARDRKTITRQDKTISGMTEWGEQALTLIYALRARVHAHNAEQHPTGAGEVQIPAVPGRLADGIRAETVREDDDDD